MNDPIPTLDRLVVVIGPPASGKTLNAEAISDHFGGIPVYDDFGDLARDYQFDDFIGAVLLATVVPVIHYCAVEDVITGPRFAIKHLRKYIYAREVRFESVARLKGNVVGWVDPALVSDQTQGA
jgi:dephospho-CoA kinase